MSSATSTDTHIFRPWHLFVLAGLLASTVAVLVVQPSDPVVLVLLVAAIGSAAAVGFALYRTLLPLGAADVREKAQIVGGHTRTALKREKTLVLRAIKELEFDRAMGKVSDADFKKMAGRLRAQALGLMKQLDVEIPEYRDVIEEELARRLGGDASEAIEREVAGAANTGIEFVDLMCDDCGTQNESDARFCKECGSPLLGST